MGFGQYSYNSRGDSSRPGIRRYNNSQTAHVWNAQTEERGQSNNGNFFFDGAALYSYGNHFLVGYIMPDGVALLNADSYSVSTSGHQSEARSAASNRDLFYVAGLTDLAPMLRAITAGNRSASRKAEARQLIREHAEALASARRDFAGRSGHWSDAENKWIEAERGETAGEYLTRLAGLPAASWPKLQREVAKAKAKREAEQAKAEHKRQRDSAVRLADMPEAEWKRRALAIIDPDSNRHRGILLGDAERRLGRLGLELLRALKLANAEGFSKRRRETLKRRRREVAERKAEATAALQLRSDVAAIRDGAETWRGIVESGELPSWHVAGRLRHVAELAERLAASPALPAESCERLAFQARRMRTAGERLQAEISEREAERREAERKARELREADYKRAWLAGEVPFARHFDADSGGAALRIKGNRLETSHGAEVPLEQAIRAFRFIKLCRERGREWKANGQKIRVGSFYVDSISAAGDMVAGCHQFTWPEI